MHVKTTHSEQIWKSPDGSRTIWEVTLKTESGDEYKMKTYSAKIAQMGFSGEVKSYLNDRGDRFARQLPAATPSGTGYQRDDNAIRAQWAIGQAISLASVKMDKEAITMPVIEKYAKELFATVTRVKGDDVTPQLEKQAEQHIKNFTQPAGAF